MAIQKSNAARHNRPMAEQLDDDPQAQPVVNKVQQLIGKMFPNQEDYIKMVMILLGSDLSTDDPHEVKELCLNQPDEVCDLITHKVGEGFCRSAHKIEELNMAHQNQKEKIENLSVELAVEKTATKKVAVIKDQELEVLRETVNAIEQRYRVKNLECEKLQAQVTQLLAAPPKYIAAPRSAFVESAVAIGIVAGTVAGTAYAAKLAYDHFFGDDAAGEGSDS